MINLDIEEFSKIYLFIAQSNAILHAERSMEDFVRFQRAYYPLLSDVLYKIIAPKIGENSIAMLGDIEFDQNRSIDDILRDVRRALSDARA